MIIKYNLCLIIRKYICKASIYVKHILQSNIQFSISFSINRVNFMYLVIVFILLKQAFIINLIFLQHFILKQAMIYTNRYKINIAI